MVGVVSYGGGLVGWVRDGRDGEFEKKFAVRHHNGSVRCIAAVARPEVMSAKVRNKHNQDSKSAQMRLESNARAFLATGGQDETIQLYDLTKLKILGNLHQHNNEVTALAFFRSKNMLSGDADGIVNVWRCYDWQLLESMTGHKGRINSISIHPTGAMALTASADKTVKLWNLLKCRCASTMKFPEQKMVVSWSPSGSTYAILGTRDIEVWSAQTSSRVCVLKHSGTTYTGRTNCFTYLSDDIIVTGGDESVLKAYCARSGAELCSVDSLQNSRIRTVTVPADDVNAARGHFSVLCAFSNGMVQLWEVIDAGLESDSEEDGERVTMECIDDLSTAGERLVGITACVMTDAQDEAGAQHPQRQRVVTGNSSNGNSKPADSASKGPAKRKKPLAKSKPKKKNSSIAPSTPLLFEVESGDDDAAAPGGGAGPDTPAAAKKKKKRKKSKKKRAKTAQEKSTAQ